MKALRQR